MEASGANPRRSTVPRTARTAATLRAARRTRGLPVDRSDPIFRALGLAADLLGRYHRYEALHADRLVRLLGAGRRVIVVGNHALSIVDPMLLLWTVFRRSGRVARFVGHESGWFKVPLLRDIAARFELVPSRDPARAGEALERDGFLMLFPGGNRESGLRSYRDEPYRLKWEGRAGFLRLALDHDAEVVFAAAVGNDESFYQSRLPIPRPLLDVILPGTGDRYLGMRLPFGALGPQLVPGVLPLPVKLFHVVSPPLDLGDRARARVDAAAFEALHRRVTATCQRFLDRAVARRERYADGLDRWLRGGQALLRRLGV
jgi:1-acyl-sn-glycerol-3-phosphate acyltransferase